MFFLTRLNRKFFTYLSIAFFVITLVFYPAVLGRLPIIGSSKDISIVQAKAPRSASTVQFDIAQAPPPPGDSEKKDTKKEEEGVIDFFKMAMGAKRGFGTVYLWCYPSG